MRSSWKLVGNFLYQTGGGAISRISLDSGEPEVLVSLQLGPSFTLDGTHLYWCNYGTEFYGGGQIRRAAL